MRVEYALLFVFLFVFITPQVWAQDEDPSFNRERGDTALLFPFNGAEIDAFGGGLGVQHWFSETTAGVLGLSVAFRTTEEDESSSRLEETERRSLSTDLVAKIERYMKPGSRLSPFLAVGAGVGIEHAHSQRTFTDGTAETDNFDAVALRGSLGLGVEYRLVEDVALSAQQRLSVRWQDRRNRRVLTSQFGATALRLAVVL